MGLSSSTIVTLGTILLLICILNICRRAVSTIMGIVAICVVAIFIVQSTSDVSLIDFTNLGEVAVDWALRLFKWAQDTFWPAVTEAVREISRNL